MDAAAIAECRSCGCSDLVGCPVPCYWVGPFVVEEGRILGTCSNCAPRTIVPARAPATYLVEAGTGEEARGAR